MFKNKKIAFYHTGSDIGPDSLKTKPLGGTESVLLYLLEDLKKSCEIDLFSHVEKEGKFDGIQYYSVQQFDLLAHKNKYDVFISIRQLLPFALKRIAPIQIYWSPDAFDQPFLHNTFRASLQVHEQNVPFGIYGLKDMHEFIDAIVCVGHWQARTFCEKFLVPKEKLFVIGNGVGTEFLSNEVGNYLSREKRLVYLSTPFRGLEHLLKIFPKLYQKDPEFKLDVFSGMQLYGLTDQEDQKKNAALYHLAKQPGVTLHKPVTKKELAKALSNSLLMVYPNTFCETFCIAVLEAQACGVPVITSDLAGLKERVSHHFDGFLIPGHPSKIEYQNQMVQHVLNLLNNPKIWNQFSLAARAKAKAFTYGQIANQWLELFTRLATKEKLARNFEFKDIEFKTVIDGRTKDIQVTGDYVQKLFAHFLNQSGFVNSASQFE